MQSYLPEAEEETGDRKVVEEMKQWGRLLVQSEGIG